jgi:hypothetical protein
MGACVFDPKAPKGLQWVVASLAVEGEILSRWRDRTQYIGQLEALAAVAVYYALADGVEAPDGSRTHMMRDRDVIHTIDNYGSLASLVKRRFKDPDITRQAHVLTAIFIALGVRPWFEFVASALNVADLPSRFAWAELGISLPSARKFPYLIPVFWGALGSSYTDLLEELSR